MATRHNNIACVILVWAVCARADERAPLLVRTAQGPVRGHWDTEQKVFAFYGVPYATAPTGTLRFKAPLPPPVWLQPKDAVNKKIMCPQGKILNFTDNFQMQEDCLVAHVFVPDTDKKNLPVVVDVHGGAYLVGAGSMFHPNNLVRTKKIIAVSFNYRLGVHGFLCLGTKDVPGNAGMKDQVALLRWVKKNIASFGGNPDDVTIVGQSAGSSGVDLLMLSKSTQGLFNKVVPESGANVAVWSIQIDPLENAKNFAKVLNFTNVDDIYALENFYRTAPFELLNSEAFTSLFIRPDSHFVFSPCLERDTEDETFLVDSPVNILKKGNYKKYPMLYGFAKMEGLFRVQFGYQSMVEPMNTKFSDFLPADLQFENDEQREELAKEVKEFYFGDKAVSEETIFIFIDYFTDVLFAYPTLRSVKLQVEAGNDRIYLYEYSYPHEFPLQSGKTISGATHCAQSAAVLDDTLIVPEDTSPEYAKHRAVMRELWLNFITTSSPVPAGSALPAWPPVSSAADRSPHMSLDAAPQLRGALLPQRARFWDGIYERHYRNPAPPPTPPPRPHTEI